MTRAGPAIPRERIAALTGEEVWRFYTALDGGELGDASWGRLPPSERRAATWGLPRTYDPDRGVIYGALTGISNPMPNTRLERHGGNPNSISLVAPADLWSTRLDYQHLPDDDWDMDINREKMLIRTVIDPDPRHVKWISPDVPKDIARDVVITVGEGRGVWVNDRDTGQFLWATPFPYDTPNFILSDIDVKTGATRSTRASCSGSRRASYRLLLQHAQLLADGLSASTGSSCPTSTTAWI